MVPFVPAFAPRPIPKPEEGCGWDWGWLSWEGVTPAWAARPEPTDAAPKGLRDCVCPGFDCGVGIEEPGWVWGVVLTEFVRGGMGLGAMFWKGWAWA